MTMKASNLARTPFRSDESPLVKIISNVAEFSLPDAQTTKDDIFTFDPGWKFTPSLRSAVLPAPIDQTVFNERIERILVRSLQSTTRKLKSQPSLLSESTANFVTHHLLRIYSHLLPKSIARSQTDIDVHACQLHIQKTLVDSAVEEPAILQQLVDQALESTCVWFLKSFESRLALRDGAQLTDVELSKEVQAFLSESGNGSDSPQLYLTRLCAQGLARCLVEAMDARLRQSTWMDPEATLGLNQKPTGSELASQPYLEVMSASHYHAVRDALSRRRFGPAADSPWPTAVLDKGPAQGYAELRPAALDFKSFLPPEEEKILIERMWKQLEELSDIDADALDALSAIWLRQAKHPDQDATAGVDEILEMRGILPKKSGQGRRGGYRAEQRNEILRALGHIQNLWMNMTQMEVYGGDSGKSKGRSRTMAIKSRAFNITDLMGQLRLDGHMDVSQFIFRPGKVFAHFLFGIGRQTALLSARALSYNPYVQAGEKRLARYLSWQWRCQAGSGCGPKIYRVGTLLDVIGEEYNPRYPNRIRERLEKLLEVLLNDQILASWQYERWSEDNSGKRGWLNDWLDSTLVLEPPAEIQEQYQSLLKSEVKKPAAMPSSFSTGDSYGEQLRKRRQELGLSQAQLAEQLGMHQTAINRIERGMREGSKATLKKIKAWLNS
jgi:DNA-binding XRE family transcriptional regulator